MTLPLRSLSRAARLCTLILIGVAYTGCDGGGSGARDIDDDPDASRGDGSAGGRDAAGDTGAGRDSGRDAGGCADAAGCDGGAEELRFTAEMLDPVAVSGTFTTPGATISAGACATKKTLRFTEVANGWQVDVEAACEFTDVGWNFSTQLFPGTYRVTVGEQPVFGEPLEVGDEPLSGVTLDMPSISVSGAILANDAPITTPYCNGGSNIGTQVKWIETTRNVTTQVRAQCDVTGWRYAATLPPGNYRVEIDPPEDAALPDFVAHVLDGVEIGAAPLERSIDLNVILGSVSGIYLRNGEPTTCAARTSVMLYEPTHRQRRQARDGCSGTPGEPVYFIAEDLLAGTYEIHFGGSGAVPLGLLWKRDVKVVDAQQIDVVIDEQQLAGTVTYNGEPLAAGTTPAPSLTFTEVEGGSSRNAPITCSVDGCTFEVYLPRGDYRVELSYRNLSARVALPSLLSIEEPSLDVPLAFEAVQLTGTITRDGAPVVSTSCLKMAPFDTLTLTSEPGAFEVALPITCDTSKGWQVSGLVPPGTYRGKVNANHANSPFLDTPAALSAEISIEAGATAYEFDAPGLVQIRGDLIVNGEATATSWCREIYFQLRDLVEGSVTKVAAVCDGGGIRLETSIVRGTYEITLDPAVYSDDETSVGWLPPAPIVVVPEVELSEDRDDLELPVEVRKVEVQLTRDGMPLADKTCGTERYDRSVALITPVDGGEVLSQVITCDGGDWRFATWLYPGVYRVDVGVRRGSTQAMGRFTVLQEMRVE